VLRALGVTHFKQGTPAVTAVCFKQALLYNQELNDQQGQANLYWNLGLVYAWQGDLPRAIASLQMLVDYENATGQFNAVQHASQVEEMRKRV
jgi:tetratricopeptide (TPR) repeat protein